MWETGDDYKIKSFGTCTLYALPNTVMVIKSRRMRRAGHTARVS